MEAKKALYVYSFTFLFFLVGSCAPESKFGPVSQEAQGGGTVDPNDVSCNDGGRLYPEGYRKTRQKIPQKIYPSQSACSAAIQTQASTCERDPNGGADDTAGVWSEFTTDDGKISGDTGFASVDLPCTIDNGSFTVGSISFDPVSPSSDSSPELTLEVSDTGAEYSIYSNSNCSGSPLVNNVDPDSSGEISVSIQVSADSETELFIQSDQSSFCTSIGSYTHDGTPPSRPGAISGPNVTNSLTHSPSLSWVEPSGAETYKVMFGTTSGSSNLGLRDVGSNSIGTIPFLSTVGDGDEVHISVYSLDEAGNMSTQARTHTFRAFLASNVPLLAAPAELEPSAGEMAKLGAGAHQLTGTCVEGNKVFIEAESANSSIQVSATDNNAQETPGESLCLEGNDTFTFILNLAGESAGEVTLNFRQNDGVNDQTDTVTFMYDKNAVNVQDGSMITSNYEHSCVVRGESTNNHLNLFCWGRNNEGQVGVDEVGGNFNLIEEPQQVVRGEIPQDEEVVKVSVGYRFTCALTDAKKAYCWGVGGSSYWQLGIGAINANKHSPVAVNMGNLPDVEFVDIDSGAHHTCAVSADKDVYCWGYGYYGNNGQGNLATGALDRTNQPVPAKVKFDLSSEGKAVQVTSGANTNCAVLDTGDIYCWGKANYGEMGNGTTAPAAVGVPVKVSKGGMKDHEGNNANAEKFIQVSLGTSNVCALTETGKIYCWGYLNAHGVHGSGHELYNAPKHWKPSDPVDSQEKFVKVSVSGTYQSHSQSACGVTENGEVYCWGYNYYGTLGVELAHGQKTNAPDAVVNFQPALEEMNVADDEVNIVDIEVGTQNVCALDDEEKVFCWGYSTNADQRLGNQEYGNTSALRPVLADF